MILTPKHQLLSPASLMPAVAESAEFHVAPGSSVSDALAAAASVLGTVRLAAGVYREPSTLKVEASVSLVGSGLADTVIECPQTAVVCADGAALVSDLAVRQTAADSAEACFALELRGSTLVERRSLLLGVLFEPCALKPAHL